MRKNSYGDRIYVYGPTDLGNVCITCIQGGDVVDVCLTPEKAEKFIRKIRNAIKENN